MRCMLKTIIVKATIIVSFLLFPSIGFSQTYAFSDASLDTSSTSELKIYNYTICKFEGTKKKTIDIVSVTAHSVLDRHSISIMDSSIIIVKREKILPSTDCCFVYSIFKYKVSGDRLVGSIHFPHIQFTNPDCTLDFYIHGVTHLIFKCKKENREHSFDLSRYDEYVKKYPATDNPLEFKKLEE